ncbi:MAG: hypothetical protein IPN95_15395 [Bacteroidetes bacterium]|nr:hypothetical protein [Bacteroidota bacterium]
MDHLEVLVQDDARRQARAMREQLLRRDVFYGDKCRIQFGDKVFERLIEFQGIRIECSHGHERRRSDFAYRGNVIQVLRAHTLAPFVVVIAVAFVQKHLSVLGGEYLTPGKHLHFDGVVNKRIYAEHSPRINAEVFGFGIFKA